MSDLRDMGESNAILGRRHWVSRDVLMAAESIYKGELDSGWSVQHWTGWLKKAELYGTEDGNVPATFQVIYMVSRSRIERLECVLVLIDC